MNRQQPASTTSASPIRRVLYILQSTAIGGMESFCGDMAHDLAGRGIEVRIIVPVAKRFDVLERRLTAGGAKVHRIDVYADRTGGQRYPSLGYWRGLLTRYIPLLRSWQPDVVHLHRGNVIGGMPMLGLARLLTDASVLYTDHDVPFPGLKRRHQIGTWITDHIVHGIVAVSRRNAHLRYTKLGAVEDRFASILNGIPIVEPKPGEQAANRATTRQQLGIPTDAPVVGCVVRLVEGKGLETLLDAFALVRAEQQATLLLVGEGPLRAGLERRAADLGIADSVVFAGFHPDPFPFMDAMDIFALAVPAGSMSIALLEAMARGLTPVITFCGPEEAVINDQTGLCAPPNDPPALARALGRLVADGALREHLGRTAALHVRTHFSIARAASDHLELYAAVRHGPVPSRLRADGPPNPRPGGCPGSAGCIS
ncbi:MAG: glycosyltransferase family 4 protein [Chloroflexi bacterium]|nr:glycosyltransferase family 4 protein [Chloroflexota bacterium]